MELAVGAERLRIEQNDDGIAVSLNLAKVGRKRLLHPRVERMNTARVRPGSMLRRSSTLGCSTNVVPPGAALIEVVGKTERGNPLPGPILAINTAAG